jgi:hypothetical protein
MVLSTSVDMAMKSTAQRKDLMVIQF